MEHVPDLAGVARALGATGFVCQALCTVAKAGCERHQALRLLAVGYTVSSASLEAPFELLKLSPAISSFSPLRGWQAYVRSCALRLHRACAWRADGRRL